MGKSKDYKPKGVGNRIWKYRKIKNLSQEELGAILSYKNASQISSWEKGRKLPNLENAVRLSRIFDITVEELFPGIGGFFNDEEPNAKKERVSAPELLAKNDEAADIDI